jgi:hypothetical protein
VSSCNNFYRRKEINNTYWESACHLCYPVCNARAPYSHLWPIRALQKLSTLSQKRHNIRKNVNEHKMCVLISSTIFVQNISHSKKELSEILQNMYFGLHVKCTWLICDFNEDNIFQTDFRKIQVKIYENPSCGKRGVPCGQTKRRLWRS